MPGPAPPLSEAQDKRHPRNSGRKIAAAEFSVTLLDGVTGSGKTEVYFEAVAAALSAKDGRCWYFLPEIALTPQWLSTVRRTIWCGARCLAFRSEPGPARRTNWRAVATGDARIVVGARSALFLPFAELGLVVIDEEHEPAFKQEDGVSYHGRDMAIVRAQIADAPVVLASATPSLETRVNVTRERFTVDRPARTFWRCRHADHQDRRHADHRPELQTALSPMRLVTALKATLEAGEQAMLFLNRRGYAPLTLCRTCGHRVECPSCAAWLTEHRFRKRLQCHHCGYEVPTPSVCPSCENVDTLVACGPGVERIAEGRSPACCRTRASGS